MRKNFINIPRFGTCACLIQVYTTILLCFNVSSKVLVSNKIIIKFCDLEAIESDEDVREFVKAKIESLVANITTDQDVATETETSRFKSAVIRFHRIFNIPADEKLVNCMFFNLCFDLNVLKCTVAQKGHTCKLKMLLQIKNSTCKLKIVHAN